MKVLFTANGPVYQHTHKLDEGHTYIVPKWQDKLWHAVFVVLTALAIYMLVDFNGFVNMLRALIY